MGLYDQRNFKTISRLNRQVCGDVPHDGPTAKTVGRFFALQSDSIGTSRHVAATPDVGRFRSETNIGFAVDEATAFDRGP